MVGNNARRRRGIRSRPPAAGPGGWPAAATTCRKCEHPFHVSPTANYAIELALADYEIMFGHPVVDDCPVEEFDRGCPVSLSCRGCAHEGWPVHDTAD